MKYNFLTLLLAATALSGCTGPVIMGSDAAVVYLTKPGQEPPADTADQIPEHQSWCYATAGYTECYAHAQNVPPDRLINVDPASAYPLDAPAYRVAVIGAKPVIVEVVPPAPVVSAVVVPAVVVPAVVVPTASAAPPILMPPVSKKPLAALPHVKPAPVAQPTPVAAQPVPELRPPPPADVQPEKQMPKDADDKDTDDTDQPVNLAPQ